MFRLTLAQMRRSIGRLVVAEALLQKRQKCKD